MFYKNPIINSKSYKAKNTLHRRGFTLVEILLVVSLIFIITLAFYNTFSNGIKIWDRGNRFVVEEDIAIFFDRIDYELRNSFSFSLIDFDGTAKRIAFPTIVKAKTSPNTYKDQIGRVEYAFDAFDKYLNKRQASYGQAVADRFSQERVVVSGIKNIEFEYYKRERDGDLVKTKIIDEKPAAVQIQVEYSEPSGQVRTMRKVINIPVEGKDNE